MTKPLIAQDKDLKLVIRTDWHRYYDVFVKRSSGEFHFLSIGQAAELLDDDSIVASALKNHYQGDHAAAARWIITTIRERQAGSPT